MRLKFSVDKTKGTHICSNIKSVMYGRSPKKLGWRITSGPSFYLDKEIQQDIVTIEVTPSAAAEYLRGYVSQRTEFRDWL